MILSPGTEKIAKYFLYKWSEIAIILVSGLSVENLAGF